MIAMVNACTPEIDPWFLKHEDLESKREPRLQLKKREKKPCAMM